MDLGNKGDFDNSEFLELKALFLKVKKEHGLDSSSLLRKLDEKELLIPVSIFNKILSALESVVKYLRENLKLSNKEISERLKRSDKTISQSYVSSKKKFAERFDAGEAEFYVPVLKLADRKLSALENIVKYLHEKFELNYSEIGRLLERDPRTIWTVYQRAKKKFGKNRKSKSHGKIGGGG